ncbi:twin-arginine translocase subunit TatC [Leifsonia shinshuensis]|uniref:Sec-independent protein translocase protein TatC n=1 Tax=Leifsonia shinshuensis TaxID=150026 RepID=A0A7G6YGN0_9MICO|nr:twin-arginine translocase subunit TatC [Leifsonia shinshuensis]QNE37645.1 twin-arginine translocase subunit TatC [Leifsonia shinshuensis]
MGLLEHLRELRKRLFRSALGVIVGAVAGWFVSSLVLNWLRTPVTIAASTQGRPVAINFPSVSAAFDLRIEIAIITGLVISSPVWLYQIFAFFVPALTRREKWYTFGFLGAAIPLFIAGCAAGLFVMPHIVQLMTGFAPAGSSSYIDASGYFDFVMKLVIVTGVAFVLPVFVVVLNLAGVVSGTAVLHSWRWAVIGICLFTAIATPAADVLSMLLLAAPMLVLYIAACGITVVNDRRRERRLEAETRQMLAPTSVE